MKKAVIIVGSLVLVGLAVFAIFYFTNNFSENTSRYTLLTTSVSPDGTYTLNAYRTEPGATTDFSIKVFLSGKKNKRIYDAYHEETVDIKWLDNKRVCINGKTLDLSEKETYDWRKQSYQ